MRAEVLDLVHRVVQDAAQRRFLPGGVVGIVAPTPDGTAEPFTAVVPFGLADVASGTPVGPDTLFEAGSISKLFTALGLATAIADPTLRISLETPLQDHAPVRVPGSRPITIGHLVTHRSGLPRMPFNESAGTAFGRSSYSSHDLWSAVRTTGLLYPPGLGWQYSNFGFGVLGTVLSELTGRPFAAVVDDAVCRPLGLTRTGLQAPMTPGPGHLAWWRHTAEARDDGPETDVATPYADGSTADRPVVAQRWDDTGALAGSGGVVSTGRDMTMFLAAALGFNAGPSAPAFAMIRQLVPAADPTLKHMGMAWQFRDGKLPGQLLFKNGGTSGMHCAIGIRPDPGPYGRTGVVLLTNAPSSVDEIALRILGGVGRMVAKKAGRMVDGTG